MPRYLDLTSQRFGRLTAIRRIEGVGKTRWLCLCDCGKERTTTVENLRSGDTQSCGCYRKEVEAKLGQALNSSHGQCRPGKVTRAYRCWSAMMSRCLNPRHRFYKDYGARGILPSEPWQQFEGFWADMGDPPPGLTLERRDNNLGYSKENCYWATWKQQRANQRPRRVTRGAKLTREQAKAVRDDPRSQTEIATAYGVSYALVRLIKLGKLWPHL